MDIRAETSSAVAAPIGTAPAEIPLSVPPSFVVGESGVPDAAVGGGVLAATGATVGSGPVGEAVLVGGLVGDEDGGGSRTVTLMIIPNISQ